MILRKEHNLEKRILKRRRREQEIGKLKAELTSEMRTMRRKKLNIENMFPHTTERRMKIRRQ